MRNKSPLLWVHAVGIISLIATFWVPPAKNFAQPDLARIIVVHLPCAILSSLWLVAASVMAIQLLRGKGDHWWDRLRACNELTTFFAGFTLASGIVFSYYQWNSWWHWDPRQTSFLFVVLLLAANFALQAGFMDEVRKMRSSAAYTLLSALPILFLVFVYPRLPQVEGKSLHPSDTVAKGKFSAEYKVAEWGMLFLIGAASVQIFRARSRYYQAIKEEEDVQLDDSRSDSAARPVVRSVPVHKE